VVITDTNGAIEYSNSRFTEVTGYQAEEIIGRTLGALNPNYPSPQEDADLRRILESGEIWSGEFQSQRKDGGFFWETLSLSAVRDEQGAPSHIVAVKEDITARKHAMFELQLSKEKAEAASRAKSEFLSKMSHELRTPLNAVIGFSQTMLDEMFGELGNPTYLEYASDIHHSGKHLLASINDILHLARIESGEFTLDEVEIELQDVIEWSVAQVRAQAESAEIEITTDLHDPALVIMGDEHSLRQIFLNLLSNAVKFTVSNGSIHVGAALTEDGDLTLSVSDDGIGIEQEKLDLVLHPFEQAENTFTRNFDGIGLGLSNVKALVELHGGTLTLASEVDKGTMVTVRLPACRIVDRATLKHTPAKASQT
ncbi:MAG: PAS domain-containing sensor histidine kinase, partial [Sphingomonadales bacterium]